jgi:hypothetical protein
MLVAWETARGSQLSSGLGSQHQLESATVAFRYASSSSCAARHNLSSV